MPALINSIGVLKNNSSDEHLYSITLESSGSNYHWFATFVSDTPITNISEFQNFMSGKRRVGVAGGGGRRGEDTIFILASGYIENNSVHLFTFRRYSYAGVEYSWGWYGAGIFVVDSNVTFTSQQIS